MGYLVMTYGWSFLPTAILGMLLAFLAGTLVSLPAQKLSGEYLILLTLAVSSVILGVFTTFPQLGGTYGLISIPQPEFFGWTMRRPSDWVIPTLVLMLGTYAICWRLGESAFGRVLKGIREDGEATQALGKNVFAYKVGVFGITAGLAGLAGAFYSGWLGLATPTVFGFSFALTLFAIVIFGGMANLTGSILGAAAVTLLEPVLRRTIHTDPAKASLYQLVIYGVALVVLMMVRPQGVLPEGFSIWRRLRYGRPPASRLEMDEMWEPHPGARVHQPGAMEIDEEERVRQVGREDVWQHAPVVLEARGITKSFGGIVAAEDLDFELRKGTITALVGPNGAGKTTAFNLLTGFIRPDRGSVKLNGTELMGLSPDKVARLGLVRSFQNVRLFNRISCVQNVMLGVQNQPGENVIKLTLGGRSAGKGERLNARKGDGLAWLRRHEGLRRSARRCAELWPDQARVARACLATEADVLLLDEPASGIDTKWVDTMLDLVEAVKEQGRTVCIVEHNLHVVSRLADHTYFMELGRITAQGTVAELTSSADLAEAYFGTA